MRSCPLFGAVISGLGLSRSRLALTSLNILLDHRWQEKKVWPRADMFLEYRENMNPKYKKKKKNTDHMHK